MTPTYVTDHLDHIKEKFSASSLGIRSQGERRAPTLSRHFLMRIFETQDKSSFKIGGSTTTNLERIGIKASFNEIGLRDT